VSPPVPTRELHLATADGPMRCFEASPDGPPKGAVIVVMEAFGVNDHIEDVARRAADAGWLALAPDFAHRSPVQVVAYDEVSRIGELFSTITDDTLLADVDAVLAHLDGAGVEAARTGIVGFCFGGRVAFLVAVRRSLGAAVTFYGGGIVTDSPLGFPALAGEAATLRTPWLGLFGDEDQQIPIPDLEALRATLDEADPVPHDLVRYAGAHHGFHCDGRPAVYDAATAADAWDRTLAWFDEHLGVAAPA
jgi:carboxymethylenebutenolidase